VRGLVPPACHAEALAKAEALALKEALDNLPRHAKRQARWKLKGELARRSAGPNPGACHPSARALRRAITGISRRRSMSFWTTAIILRGRRGRGPTGLEIFCFGKFGPP
jgi:hypothetical protein